MTDAQGLLNSEPQLNQTYIQTGKVNLVFKYFPVNGPDSTPAAMAAQCANDQGKFWTIMIFYSKTKDQQTLVGPAKTISRNVPLKHLE